MITPPDKRIQAALRLGREIDVIEQGGEQAMIAYEHPNLMARSLKQGARIDAGGHQRDMKKARCYWYRGEDRQTAVFNLENLRPVYPKGAKKKP